MKKQLFLLTTLLLTTMTSCDDNKEQEYVIDNIYAEDYRNIVSTKDLTLDNNALLFFDVEYEDDFISQDDVLRADKYINNKKASIDTPCSNEDDVKFTYYNDEYAKFVSLSDGYSFVIPTEKTFNYDFSLGNYRSKLFNDETTLTISTENKNPYYNSGAKGWQIYRDEWMVCHVNNEYWLEANNIRYTRNKKFEDTSIMSGYSIIEFDLEILNPGKITKMFYNIAVIRKSNDYVNFILLVMKSTTNKNEQFDTILSSYAPVTPYGKTNNSTLNNLELKANPNWNEATKNYFNKLVNQNYTEWAIYKGNLPDNPTQKYVMQYQKSYDQICEDFDYNFGVISSYTHVSWDKKCNNRRFPKFLAQNICGDGTDNKPVLQFTYQFTDNNNAVSGNSTWNQFSPMFDILRGYDENQPVTSYQNQVSSYFTFLAQDIKEYGKPVLFRLNNEMNSDWTSYSGIVNLLDPDLFQASWRVLYNVFEEEKVDNCIWIFNPIAKSCPYSSWSEDLCYFPGNDYVQALGLTYYVMNNTSNDAEINTFKSCYTYLYNKNNDIFNKYPWIISEFACGAGNNYEHAASQKTWISNMFKDLNARADYCKNIKVAVWFSCNDYDGDGNVVNALNFYQDTDSFTIVDQTGIDEMSKGLKGINKNG